MEHFMRLKFVMQSAVFFVLGVVTLGAQADPRHIYLTYSDDPESSVDINIIVESDVEVMHVYYDTEPRHEVRDAYANHVEAVHVPTPMALADGRALYVAALKNLTPGTLYSFVAGESEFGYSRELKFKTLPGGDAPLRFVNGGDMGADGRARTILKLAAQRDPDFALLGGDLAYENGMLGDGELVDAWLDNWFNYMRRTDGGLVPIITCIGNHEVNKTHYDDPMLRSPWYLSLFGRQGEKAYFSRQVGDNMVFIALDSAHLNPVEGEQTAWLAAELEKYKAIPHKFAFYHVPMYPAFGDYDGKVAAQMRELWAPLFDQYGLRVGFEHHDHVAKRTKPIKGNKVAESGTVYIGDGAMGRESRDVDRELRWYSAMEVSEVHCWIVDVSNAGVKLEAIDRSGAAFDSVSLP